jgi:hypothetical protein
MMTNSLADLALKMGVSEAQAKSHFFSVVDFLLNEDCAAVPEEAVDCGMYFMPAYVGDTKMMKAFGEVLWASYEHYCEKKVSGPAGPWVHIDSNGIHISKERHPPFDIVNGVAIITSREREIDKT